MLLWEYNFIMNTIIRSLNMANNTMLKLIKLIFRLHFPIFKWFLDSEGEISVLSIQENRADFTCVLLYFLLKAAAFNILS